MQMVNLRQWWFKRKRIKTSKALIKYCSRCIVQIEQEANQLKNNFFGDNNYKASKEEKNWIIERLIILDEEIEQYRKKKQKLIEKIDDQRK